MSLPHLSIDEWLKRLDLTLYRGLFKDYNAVEDILWISERDLKNMGINNGAHRARIGSSLTVLKEKLVKLSKEDLDFNGNGNKGSSRTNSGNKSFSSLSPVSNINLEKPLNGVRSWPCTIPSSSSHSNRSSPRLSMDGFSTEATADELKRSLEKELSLDSSDLRSYAWYHGTILRQRAEDLVSQDGDFLVRDCISQPGDFVITCKWKSISLHFIINKIIRNPDTVYEKIQYCFENESFDSIPDFITYYVGSKQPLSKNSGAIIRSPVNRTMPLSYYTSRYGVQCQIQYVARKLETLPQDKMLSVHCSDVSIPSVTPTIKVAEDSGQVLTSVYAEKSNTSHTVKLTRTGSDPMLSPSTERKQLKHRPHSGNFSSEVKTMSLMVVDKPPPKPSRVPSKKLAQRPMVIKRNRSISIDEDIETVPTNTIKIQGVSLAHKEIKRQSSETRFSFLDRPSISDDGSESNDPLMFTIPLMNPSSQFNPQNFKSLLLNEQNSPLEGSVLSKVKKIILAAPSRMLAYHLTRVDLEVAKNSKDIDLGLGVSSGLELCLLPQGKQLQKDLLERMECIKLFVAITLLTTPSEEERVQLLNKWLEIATETKTAAGNFFGFSSIMLGLTIPEIQDLQSTWLALRHTCTNSALVFETKLRPTFKALQQAAGLEAPNTCLPFLLTLNLILHKYEDVMDFVQDNPFETELISKAVLDFDIPGCNNAADFGLELLENHLEAGRYIIQQFPVFKQNGMITLEKIKFEDVVLDIFSTEFHLRLLWGFRGSIVCLEERYQKFQKVLTLLHNKCNERHS